MTAPREKILPHNFRKLDLMARRAALESAYGEKGLELGAVDGADARLAEAMVESALGSLPIPLGIAAGFLIDGRLYDIPMAVEEPSVIAAASFAARLIRIEGGFSTWASDPVMTAQVFLEGVAAGRESEIEAREGEIRAELDALLDSMRRRGGGYRGLELSRNEETGLLRADLRIDVRDAMGANVLNTAAERAAARLESLSGGRRLMCILTNDAGERRAGASFEIAVRRLARGGFSGEETARRIELASRLADGDPSRAVTQNKGVMNGISALALATGNDSRALEAGVHFWAARDGRYGTVSGFRRVDDRLEGRIELPLAIASVGGSVGVHPATALALRILRRPGGQDLARIAAALGLAQNFAALFALVTEGIQSGHMRLHAKKGRAGGERG
jgi:hydroxymethylglutaryl-CoA reductase